MSVRPHELYSRVALSVTVVRRRLQNRLDRTTSTSCGYALKQLQGWHSHSLRQGQKRGIAWPAWLRPINPVQTLTVGSRLNHELNRLYVPSWPSYQYVLFMSLLIVYPQTLESKTVRDSKPTTSATDLKLIFKAFRSLYVDLR